MSTITDKDRKIFSNLIKNFAVDKLTIDELSDLMSKTFSNDFNDNATVLDIYLTLQHFDVFWQERKSNDNFDKSAKNMLLEIARAFEKNLVDEVRNLNDEFSVLKR